MKINLHEISIRELTEGYIDSQEEGVFAYGGRLNVRPAFQREFIYKDKQRDDVIRSVRHNYPLNVMYWVRNGDSDTFGLLDGQQRTVSICRYVSGGCMIDGMGFANLPVDEREKILDYRLQVYICEGGSSEILDWFKIINIQGTELTKQEQRNAVLTGKWLHDAKMRFSKTSCEAWRIAHDYMKGSCERQDYLETAISWIADRDGIKGRDPVLEYMSIHQHDENCNDLWLYFQAVISWVKVLFTYCYKEMQGIEWGLYYNKYHERNYDSKKLELEAERLYEDDDVTRAAGIFEYLIDGNEKHLSIRKFSRRIKKIVYQRQRGKCKLCGKECKMEEMEADHITPWSQGGRTIESNCQLLCKDCNRTKGDK